MQRDRHFLVLLACFVLSGLAGLIYQTAWTEELGLVFGGSELAVSAVLAAYMAGLMLGAVLAGRWMARLQRPVLVYAILELGIAITALLVPVGLRLASTLQQRLLGGLPDLPDSGSTESALFFLGAAFVVLMPPTTMMGATLPLLARGVVRREDELGPRIAWLYTANTFGAAAGTLTAAYLLLPRLGLGYTIWVAVTLNGVVFGLALLLEKNENALDGSGIGGSGVIGSGVESPVPEPSDKGTNGAWILPLTLISGFVFLTYEILWTRLLSHLLGGSIYAFATMLATFLVGLSLGSALASRWSRSRAQARTGFMAAQVMGALAFYAAFAWVDFMPSWLAGSPQDPAVFARTVALTAALLLPGAVSLGAAFPFAVRILAAGVADAGTASARVFAWNTLGAIGGAVAAGFVLLPSLKLAGTMTAALAANLALALVAGMIRPWPRGGARALPLLAAAALVLLAVAPSRTPWQVLRTSPLSGVAADGELAFYSIGRSSVVLVLDQGSEWRLSTNGLPESGILPRGSRPGRFNLARWMSLLPQASRPEMRSLLVVGLGAGVTVENVPAAITDLHVVELEEEVVRANQALSAERAFDPLDDPRLRIHTNDARSALQLTEKSFDAIVSQPSHPWTAGSSHLFTREFFELVRQRLAPDGVFVQWMGLRFVDGELMRSLLATLATVFSHVEVFEPPPGGGFLFMASNEPLALDANAAAGFAQATAEWRRVGVHLPEDILLARVLDTDGVRLLAEDAPLVTDRRNLLQIRSPRILNAALGADGAGRLYAGLDLLPRRAAGEPDLYLLRRLLMQGRVERAAQMAEAIADPTSRRVAHGLLLLRRGSVQAGFRQLGQVLEQDPTAETISALVQLRKQDVVRDGLPPQVAAQIERHPNVELVVEGWRLAALRNLAALKELDEPLSAVPARHPMFWAAQRLRLSWRQASGDPALGAEGLEMLDALLAAGGSGARGGGPRDIVQRAQLAFVAKNQDAARASLRELQRRQKLPDDVRRQALALARRLQAGEPPNTGP